MAHAYSHFRHLSRSPKPVGLSSIFRGSHKAYSHDGSISAQLREFVSQFNRQASLLNRFTKSAGVGSILGGSVAGGLLAAGQGGFSLSSILKHVFPLGGLISGIAGLFHSAPTPAPLNEYDAPPSLGFQAVLGADGRLSQGAGNQYGATRAASSGLDLIDATGGPYSPYVRAANGSLVGATGDPATRYAGTLNLPEAMQSLVSNATNASGPAPRTPTPSIAASRVSEAAASVSTGSSAAPLPSFDSQWFDDHGGMIASAVRNQLLNFHPIVDAINDL